MANIKTRKIKLIPSGDDRSIKNTKHNEIKNYASILSKVGNEVIRLHVSNQYEIDRLTEGKTVTKGQATKILEEKLGTSIRNSGYQLMSNYGYIPSDIRTSFNSVIFKTISNNFFDILNGKISIPSFRKTNIGIPFSARNDKTTGITKAIKKIDDKYILSLPTSNSSEIKNLDFELFFGKDRSNNKIIIDRILSNEYKLCDSSLLIKDNEIYFMAVIQMPEVIQSSLDVNKIMGIDVGINRPVSIYISDEKHQPQQITIGEKIQHDRVKMSKHRSNLQKNLKYTGGGHGTKRKLKDLDRLRDKESNWATNINHKISKEIIDICLNYKVGTIKMEDLSGITDNTNNYFLKSWKYYQLQEFIKYKAKMVGIDVIWVNPRNTSITCPVCLEANKENRSNKDKTIFKCINEMCSTFNKVQDADIIAAENISKLLGFSVKPNSKEGKMKKIKEKKELALEFA